MSGFRWKARELTIAAGGERVAGTGEAEFSDIAIDSRAIAPDQLFVAIRGERHDGHRFAPAVVESGVRGVVVARDALNDLPLDVWREAGVTCLAVDDTTRALGALANFRRRLWGGSVAAVTGSNGKTSTRAMMAAVLARAGPTLATRGNFNNEIGLPLTLFRLRPEHRWAAVELGMNHFGEIARLARIAAPDIGVITNIGPAHLEGVGSLDGVLRAKAELIAEMPAASTAVLNADDSRLLDLARATDRPVALFGRSERAAIRAQDETPTPEGTAFTLVLPNGRARVRLSAAGRFQVSNALAAAAVGHLAGLDAGAIAAELAEVRPEKGRMVPLETRRGIHLIDDTYNANPASLAAAVQTLAELAPPGRRALVVGDMLELGDAATELHRQAGRLAVAAGVDRVLGSGPLSAALVSAAAEAGLPTEACFSGPPGAVADRLTETLNPGDWVLVKGSRGMAMERVLNLLREWADR
ncbi:MAG: UDP-N-acetylmuramoyl-tripeptide--D-alanyl-D-alanine ligase [Desulfococcaceae bacterium]